MDAYAEYFALGTKTGVELSESSGIMSSPQEYAENNPGFTWTDGLTAQTAIGQCDNMFTPHPVGHLLRHHCQRRRTSENAFPG